MNRTRPTHHLVPLRRGLAVTLTALTSLSACGSSSTVSRSDALVTPPAAAPTTTSVADAVVVTSTAAVAAVPVSVPVPTTPTVPSSAPAPACGDRAPSADAFQVRTTTGDHDGDGAPDTVTSWGEHTAGGVEWFLRVQLAVGVASSQSLGDLGAGFLAVLGAIDLDASLGAGPGGNDDEIVAIVGPNVAGYDLGFFGVDGVGCVYRFVRTDGAGFFELPVGSGSSSLSGLMCDGGAGSRFAVALTAESLGAVWKVTSRRVERPFEGALQFGTALVSTLPLGSTALEAYGRAECDGTLLIGGPADY